MEVKSTIQSDKYHNRTKENLRSIYTRKNRKNANLTPQITYDVRFEVAHHTLRYIIVLLLLNARREPAPAPAS